MLTMAQNHGPPFHGHVPPPDGSDINWQQRYGPALSHPAPRDGACVFQQGPPVMPGPAAEVKPRLTKVQHDILERYFQQQNKPTTATKKQYAVQLGVPLEKINNWFQNRRAKVKQDAKKQQNNIQNLHLYSGMPGHSFSHPQQPSLAIPFMPAGSMGSQDVSPTSRTPELGPQQQMDMSAMAQQLRRTQDFGSGLQPISESARPGSAEDIMNSLFAVGYNFPSSGDAPAMPQDVQFDASQSAYENFNNGPNPGMDSGMNSGMNPDGSQPMIAYKSEDGSMEELGFNANAYNCSGTSSEKTDSLMGPTSTNTSPYSSATEARIHGIPTSSEGGSYECVNDAFSWNQNTGFQPSFDQCGSDMNVQSHQHLQVPMMDSSFIQQQQQEYQQHTLSSQELEPGQFDANALQGSMHGSPDVPRMGPPEMYDRRNSSTAALAESMSAVGIQNQQQHGNVEFKQPAPPSNIADRRRGPRPAALGSAALRSASYSAGMPPSPGANDQTLRRIRSSGIPGRISKNPVSSAQRSPLSFTFAGSAPSPKFTRHASFQVVTTPNDLPTSGSFAPPTPLTPNEMGVFPPWQNGGQAKSQSEAPDYSGPEALNAPSIYATSATGSYANMSSPPSTPLDAQQFAQYRAHFGNGPMFHNTPPQSAPPTQQSFPRVTVPTGPSEYLAPTDVPIMASRDMQMQMRRPSLPEAMLLPGGPHDHQGQVPIVTAAGDIHTVYSLQYGQEQMQLMQQQQQFAPGQMTHYSHDGLLMPGMEPPRATSMPDLFVHEYTPPRVRGQTPPPRPVQESGPKNYIFTNTGPEHFNKREQD